ncbi:MAG TPA: ComF family protein [Terriglobia bacterium]|nr:ComF family protein [Terriglobia bacterium]
MPDPRSPLQEIADSLFSVLFPTQCSICGGEVVRVTGLGVCRRCWSGVEPWEGICCGRCGLPMASRLLEESDSVLCGQCRIADPDFDVARTFGLYRENLRALILQLKFQRRERLGRRLGGYLAQTWERLEVFREAQPVLLVPVPLFHARERERGFNQARALAEGLAHHLPKGHGRKALRVATKVLVRTRQTLPQTGLKAHARRKNVQGAFRAIKPERLEGRQVVLIDDVMTTGATLSACAQALKQGGAKTVFALALARSTPQFPDTADQREVVNVDESGGDWT